MKSSGKQPASGAETRAISEGTQKVAAANTMKIPLEGAADAYAKRDDSNILLAGANAGSAKALADAVSTAPDAFTRSMAATLALPGTSQAMMTAATDSTRSLKQRMSTAIDLHSGAQDAASESVLAQANSANRIGQMKTQASTARTSNMMNSIANIGTAYVAQKNHVDEFNAASKDHARRFGDKSYETKNLWNKKITVNV